MENKKMERASGSSDCACPYGMPESKFPYSGRCFRKSTAIPDDGYIALCPHCGIWTSLPEGTALKVTHIFDCAVCGYGKRISEEVK